MLKSVGVIGTFAVCVGFLIARQDASDAPRKEKPAKGDHAKWTAPVVVKGGSFAGLKPPANATGSSLLMFSSLELSGEGVGKQWPEKDGWRLVPREICLPGAKETTVTFVDGRSDKTKIGDVKIPLTDGVANVVFALRVVRDPKEQKTSVMAAAFRVSSEGFDELEKFDVPPSAMTNCGDGKPPYLESGSVGGGAGSVMDIVAAWSWNGADADVYMQTARARDHGGNTELQGAGPELAKFAKQPLSKWPKPVLLVVFTPPAK